MFDRFLNMPLDYCRFAVVLREIHGKDDIYQTKTIIVFTLN